MRPRSISLTKSVMLIFTLCFGFSFFSCDKNIEEIYDYPNVDERLHEHFRKFQEEGKKRGIKVDLERLNVAGSIEKINVRGVVGLCNINNDNKVIIDEDFWQRSSYSSKELIVFHELGHCYLQLSHSTKASDSGVCKSIMRPGDGSCLDFYNAQTRTKLIDDLFLKE